MNFLVIGKFCRRWAIEGRRSKDTNSIRVGTKDAWYLEFSTSNGKEGENGRYKLQYMKVSRTQDESQNIAKIIESLQEETFLFREQFV